jgi:hypothetical protein
MVLMRVLSSRNKEPTERCSVRAWQVEGRIRFKRVSFRHRLTVHTTPFRASRPLDTWNLLGKPARGMSDLRGRKKSQTASRGGESANAKDASHMLSCFEVLAVCFSRKVAHPVCVHELLDVSRMRNRKVLITRGRTRTPW